MSPEVFLLAASSLESLQRLVAVLTWHVISVHFQLELFIFFKTIMFQAEVVVVIRHLCFARVVVLVDTLPEHHA